MSEQTVKLNQLATLMDERQAIIDGIMAEPWAQEAKARYEGLQADIANATVEIGLTIDAYQASIINEVYAMGETVKGARLMAVWTKPRVTWDSKVLEGYVIAHPELAAARHVGQPSVSIRPVGK